MRALALTALVLTAPLAFGESEASLHQRCLEQERQIAALETEIDSLHSKLALERRRARGTDEITVADAPVAVPVATQGYKVQSGDTLSSIARRNGTSADSLMKLNGIKDPTRLRIGQTIQVTGSTAVAEAPAAPTPQPKKAPAVVANKPTTYKVVAGDTFYKVASKHSLGIAQLQALNPGVDPGHILVGQTLGVAGDPRKAIVSSKAPSTSGTKLITTNAPTKKSTPAPAPKAEPKPVTKSLPKPAPAPVAKSTPKPAPLPEKKEEPKPTTFSSIIVMDQLSFGDFAQKHGTTTDQLNALNGLNLKSSTLLAKGSELYVSSR